MRRSSAPSSAPASAPGRTSILPARHRALPRIAASIVAGIVVGAVSALAFGAALGIGAGWTACAGAYSLCTWAIVRGMDGRATREHASAEDAGRRSSEGILLVAVIASVAGVGLLLVAGHPEPGDRAPGWADAALGALMVVASWFLVHIIYMLRYARAYMDELPDVAIDFPADDAPDFRDFAYFSICLGMTYQVSDQSVRSRTVRRMVTSHTLLSYGLGAVVVACTVNLVIQLASQ